MDKVESKEKKKDLICDLDLILNRKFTFRLFDKERKIKPITTQVFFEFADGLIKFKETKYSDFKELEKAYFDLIKLTTDDISLSDVSKMEMVQKYVLLQHISTLIMGDRQKIEDTVSKSEDEKKKSLMH